MKVKFPIELIPIQTSTHTHMDEQSEGLYLLVIFQLSVALRVHVDRYLPVGTFLYYTYVPLVWWWMLMCHVGVEQYWNEYSTVRQLCNITDDACFQTYHCLLA